MARFVARVQALVSAKCSRRERSPELPPGARRSERGLG